MKPISMYLDGISFWGPGVENWDALRGALSDDVYSPSDERQYSPDCLSPRAARRVSPQIRLALTVAERIAPSLHDDSAWVFASSAGEGETLQVILEALRKPTMMIQPLRFQNAVHNAASGQWSIAAGVTGPITSIAAHDETVGAGFAKAGAQLMAEQRSVGLVFYDVPMPEPLNAKRPLGVPLGAGFALSPISGPMTLATIQMGLTDAPFTTPVRKVSRALIATGNPIASVMPLIEQIVCGAAPDVVVGLHGGTTLSLKVTPV